MRLLHLSDIHFKNSDSNTSEGNPEVPYRTRLEEDLADLCADQIRVDAILVSGDIAFKGHPDEYKSASDWLMTVAEICGCTAEGIFTVPGNHDVDRKVCERPAVSAMQNAIASGKTVFERDKTFQQQLADVESARLLFSPLEAYNAFAAPFDCNVYPEQPFWYHDLPLTDEVSVRLFGLTSTYISGSGNRDDEPARLFLGSAQTSLNPRRNVINLVLCHHPPSWFTEGGDAAKTINARAMLQFFGHEHDQRCEPLPSYIRFSAGATNPERDKAGWSPGYNLIDLSVVGQGVDRAIKVQAQLRRLQSAPQEHYVALEASKGHPVWEHTMRFPVPPSRTFGAGMARDPLPSKQPETKMAEAVHQVAQEAGAEMMRVLQEHQADKPREVTVSEPSTHNLVYRYWQLPSNRMRDIAIGLGLMTADDGKMPPHEAFSKVLKAAKERGLLNDLARQIEKYEKKD